LQTILQDKKKIIKLFFIGVQDRGIEIINNQIRRVMYIAQYKTYKIHFKPPGRVAVIKMADVLPFWLFHNISLL